MKRRLLNLLTALSLLLCVAAAVLWVRSYLVADILVSPHGKVMVASEKGLIALIGFWHPSGWAAERHPQGWRWQRGKFSVTVMLARKFAFKGRLRQWLPVAFSRDNVGATEARTAVLRHGLLVVLTAFLPALQFTGRWRRGRWQATGLCPTCGYDLRATPERCPECGMVR